MSNPVHRPIVDDEVAQNAAAESCHEAHDENADRIGVVHLKDMIVTADGAQRFAEIYEGNMNYDGIGRALGEIGVRYAAVEQDDCYGKDPFACLERSRGNIRKHWEV